MNRAWKKIREHGWLTAFTKFMMLNFNVGCQSLWFLIDSLTTSLVNYLIPFSPSNLQTFFNNLHSQLLTFRWWFSKSLMIRSNYLLPFLYSYILPATCCYRQTLPLISKNSISICGLDSIISSYSRTWSQQVSPPPVLTIFSSLSGHSYQHKNMLFLSYFIKKLLTSPFLLFVAELLAKV